MKKYTEKQIQNSLITLNQELSDKALWVIRDGKLIKNFKFKNFLDAFAWMSQIAKCVEKLNHHPDWCNSYNEVIVSLITHEVKGLSELDFKLAEKMESYYD